MRNFGIQSVTSRLASGAQPRTGSLHGKYAPANQNSLAAALPPGAFRPNSEGSNLPLFIPREPPLEFGEVAQTLIDVVTMLAWLLLACDGAVAIGASIRILFSFIHVELG